MALRSKAHGKFTLRRDAVKAAPVDALTIVTAAVTALREAGRPVTLDASNLDDVQDAAQALLSALSR